MKKVIFREAKLKDLKGVKRLISRYPKQLLQSPLPKISEFFVAEAEGRVVACCALEIYSKKLAEVRSLAVVPEFQGRGIAAKLIKMCLLKAKRKKTREVLTITGSPKLFRRLGFRSFQKQKYALFR